MKFHLGRPYAPDSYYSEANMITLVRLVLCLAFFILAIVLDDLAYNYIALAIHWVLDMADGWYSRRFKQETILGAQIDIIADRFEIFFFLVILLHFKPFLYLPVALYLIDFGFIDTYLSIRFKDYDIISPNYFYKVDPLIHRLNFTPYAKCANSSLVLLLIIFFPQYHVVASVLALGLISIKSYSVYRLFLIDSVGI